MSLGTIPIYLKMNYQLHHKNTFHVSSLQFNTYANGLLLIFVYRLPLSKGYLNRYNQTYSNEDGEVEFHSIGPSGNKCHPKPDKEALRFRHYETSLVLCLSVIKSTWH